MPSDIIDRLTDLYAVEQRDSAPGFSDPGAIEDAIAEIGRLRAIIRVNGLRAGATHAEIDKVLYGEERTDVR